ncbi:hypothetical protein VTO73DRAFT_604 [Trametes versicolor]
MQALPCVPAPRATAPPQGTSGRSGNGRLIHVLRPNNASTDFEASRLGASLLYLLLLTGLTSGNAPPIYSGRFVVITGITVPSHRDCQLYIL